MLLWITQGQVPEDHCANVAQLSWEVAPDVLSAFGFPSNIDFYDGGTILAFWVWILIGVAALVVLVSISLVLYFKVCKKPSHPYSLVSNAEM
jgi:hypothetical protein